MNVGGVRVAGITDTWRREHQQRRYLVTVPAHVGTGRAHTCVVDALTSYT